MNDRMPSWVEWEWDGRHPSCRRAILGHPEPDREFRQRHQEVVDWPDISPIRDIWS